jgi:hypothetical protein
MLKDTQLTTEGYRLTKLVKIPLLRMPLTMLAVIADMFALVFGYLLCHYPSKLLQAVFCALTSLKVMSQVLPLKNTQSPHW